jgi:hypothetical protein
MHLDFTKSLSTKNKKKHLTNLEEKIKWDVIFTVAQKLNKPMGAGGMLARSFR